MDNPISLNFILNEIYAVLSDVKALIGGRIIILECEDNKKLLDLYIRHGFTLIEIEKIHLPLFEPCIFILLKNNNYLNINKYY